MRGARLLVKTSAPAQWEAAHITGSLLARERIPLNADALGEGMSIIRLIDPSASISEAQSNQHDPFM